MLKHRGYRVSSASDPEGVVAAVRKCRFDLVTLDLEWQFSDRTGIDILQQVRKIDPHLPVIIITGHATLETAKQATRLGAYDYLEKMTDREKTLLVVRNAVESGRLKRAVEQSIVERSKNYEIVGVSRGIEAVREAISQFAPRDVTVLIEGETGCGKELVARQLHLHSLRRNEPMVTVGGGELSRDLGQDVLYGHTPGAFTGSARERASALVGPPSELMQVTTTDDTEGTSMDPDDIRVSRCCSQRPLRKTRLPCGRSASSREASSSVNTCQGDHSPPSGLALTSSFMEAFAGNLALHDDPMALKSISMRRSGEI